MKEGYRVIFSRRFKQQRKKLMRSGRNNILKRLDFTITLLAQGDVMPESIHNHRLSGFLEENWECHLAPDWLLLYRRHENDKIIQFISMGSHADLFG